MPSGKFIKILLPKKKEIWYEYDSLQFQAKKNIIVFGSESPKTTCFM